MPKAARKFSNVSARVCPLTRLQKRNQIKLEDFPDEILLKILEHCPIVLVRSVCARFRILVPLTTELYLSANCAMRYAEMMRDVFECCKREISRCPGWIRTRSEMKTLNGMIFRCASQSVISKASDIDEVCKVFRIYWTDDDDDYNDRISFLRGYMHVYMHVNHMNPINAAEQKLLDRVSSLRFRGRIRRAVRRVERCHLEAHTGKRSLLAFLLSQHRRARRSWIPECCAAWYKIKEELPEVISSASDELIQKWMDAEILCSEV
jgi:hypothetical protein